MSDNPADSLRRELEAALAAGLNEWPSADGLTYGPTSNGIVSQMSRAWPLITTALEAARAAVTPLIRAQAFTEAAEAIEALRNGFKPSDFIGEQMPGWIQGLIDAEEVVREARAVSDVD